MHLKVPLLVSVDQREIYELFLPAISSRSFRGISLAELRDDVALHLMESIPQEKAEQMPVYAFCPHIELRKVKLTVELPAPELGRNKKIPWTGRLAVVLRQWPKEGFVIANVPRLGTETFAVFKTAYLEAGLKRFIQSWAKKHHTNNLDPYVCRSYEYLDIIEIDVDFPSILPSRRPKRRKKKKKNKKKNKQDKKNQKKTKKPKRRLIPPTTLREVGINLTHRAMDGRISRAYGREDLVEQIRQQLDPEGAAILLVGPSGVGKTAIIHEVIHQVAREERPIQQRNDFWEVDGNRLIAGMSFVGGWEQRCQNMIEELHLRQDILYVNDLPSLVYSGRSAHSDTNIASYIEPHIARHELRIIGECTPERLEATREENPGFFARFRIIQVPELPERKTLTVLVHAMRQLEAEDNISISPETLEAILAITRRFLVHQCYPGKAITLLRRIVSDYQNVETDLFGRRLVTREHLVDFFSRQSGLPRFILWEQQARSHEAIRAYFDQRIISQPNATSAVSDIIAVLQQGLNDPERPLATLLFVGPTGVGKTETAKALAAYLFGDQSRLIRFDMSEFMSSQSVTRLIGDRFQPDGELTRRVQQQPFSVVLLDEIEKAHPSIFDAMLQVLGEGRLTNAAGRTIDFCNTVVIMTSNLGVREANHSLGFSTPDALQVDQHFTKAAEGFFRPEFFNRIDRIVPFRSLHRKDLDPLVRRLLQQLFNRRGLRHSHVIVRVDPELVELLIDQGFDPQYGARSMKRLLEQRLSVPLAQHLVSHSIQQTTLIQLFPQAQEIQMTLWGLQEPERARLPGISQAERWHDLEDWHALLQNALAQLQASPSLQHIQEEHTTLLDTFNEDGLDDAQHERMLSLSTILSDRRALSRKLDHIAEEYLAPYKYIETITVTRARALEWNESQRQVVLEAPVEQDRQRLFPLASSELYETRVELASLLYRTQTIQTPQTHPTILRFLPASDDLSSIDWSIELALSFCEAWISWASVQGLLFCQGTWQSVPPEAWTFHNLMQERKQDPTHPWHDARAAALSFQGPGLKEILLQEAGFYQHHRHIGPDLICDLVRVEVIDTQHHDAEPPQLLNALEQEYEAYCDTRRKGNQAPNPRPQMPIRRTFEEQACHDSQTGETIHNGNGYHLQRVAMLRLFSAFLHPQPSPSQE